MAVRVALPGSWYAVGANALAKVSQVHPFTDEEWISVLKDAKRYFAGRGDFQRELKAWNDQSDMREWVRRKYSGDSKSLEDSKAYSLSDGDLFSLPGIQQFFSLARPKGTFPDQPADPDHYYNTTSPLQASVADRKAFWHKCDELWNSARSNILREAGERKIAILISLSQTLSEAVMKPCQQLIGTSLESAQDESLSQVDRLLRLSEVLNSVYAIFTCSRYRTLHKRSRLNHLDCSSRIEECPNTLLRLPEALAHFHFTEVAVHRTYDSKRNRRQPADRRVAPFDPRSLATHTKAIVAVEMLLKACEQKAAALHYTSLGRTSLVPQVGITGPQEFDKDWRFTCAKIQCNQRGDCNIFTNMSHHRWNEMVREC